MTIPKNIEIFLVNCVCSNEIRNEIHFDFEHEGFLGITTTNNVTDVQHDFDITKEDYLFLRELMDKHFNIE